MLLFGVLGYHRHRAPSLKRRRLVTIVPVALLLSRPRHGLSVLSPGGDPLGYCSAAGRRLCRGILPGTSHALRVSCHADCGVSHHSSRSSALERIRVYWASRQIRPLATSCAVPGIYATMAIPFQQAVKAD